MSKSFLALIILMLALVGAAQADLTVGNANVVNMHVGSITGNGSVKFDSISIDDTGSVGNVDVANMEIRAFAFSNSMSFSNIKCRDSFNLGKGMARYLGFGDVTARNFGVDSVTSSTPGYGSFSTGRVTYETGRINNLDQYGTIKMGKFEGREMAIGHMDPNILVWNGIANSGNFTIDDIEVGDRAEFDRISANNFAVNNYEFDNSAKFQNITCDTLHLGTGKARYLSFTGDVRTRLLEMDSLVSTTPGYGSVDGKDVFYTNAKIGTIQDFGVVRLGDLHDNTKST